MNIWTVRDPLYTEGFREILKNCGVKVMRLPAKNPNLNAFAERFVLSVRTECLNWIVPLGEAHLRRAITEFVQHYHCERNHQGIDNALIVASEVVNGTGRVVRRERLGGLLGFYQRAAA
jgi:putative transposase